MHVERLAEWREEKDELQRLDQEKARIERLVKDQKLIALCLETAFKYDGAVPTEVLQYLEVGYHGVHRCLLDNEDYLKSIKLRLKEMGYDP
jgi:hypothetical protein